MKKSLGLLLLLSVSAYGQRMHECQDVGRILKTDFLHMNGDTARSALNRSGNMDIPATASFTGIIKTRTYRIMRDTVCGFRDYQFSENVCSQVSPDIALGRGNSTLAGFYDLRVGLIQRADMFARAVRFDDIPVNSDRTEIARRTAERLDAARQILTMLTQYATTSGIPRSWAEFAGQLNQAVSEGQLTLHLVDEITKLNSAVNQRSLGFLPLEGVQVQEGRGNGKLNRLFDLGNTPDSRALLLKRLILGAPEYPAIIALSNSFIEYAQVNGIPASWDQFGAMVRQAVVTNRITSADFRRMVVDMEMQNRANLGFEINAQSCQIVTSMRRQNVIETRERSEFAAEVLKNYEVSISNAPLLQKESEQLALAFDGLTSISLQASSNFNNYNVLSQAEVNGVVKINVNGNRKQLRPDNSLNIDFKRAGEVLNLKLQNTNFNAKMGGKVVVKVEFWEGKFLKDRKHGEETYELVNGDLNAITAKLKNKDVDYVKVWMQVVGTPYYNAEFSDEKKAKN